MELGGNRNSVPLNAGAGTKPFRAPPLAPPSQVTHNSPAHTPPWHQGLMREDGKHPAQCLAHKSQQVLKEDSGDAKRPSRAPAPRLTSDTASPGLPGSGSSSAATRLCSSSRSRVRAAWSSTSNKWAQVTRRKHSWPCTRPIPCKGHTKMGRQSSAAERPRENWSEESVQGLCSPVSGLLPSLASPQPL